VHADDVETWLPAVNVLFAAGRLGKAVDSAFDARGFGLAEGILRKIVG
jgi:hypothetical protein